MHVSDRQWTGRPAAGRPRLRVRLSARLDPVRPGADEARGHCRTSATSDPAISARPMCCAPATRASRRPRFSATCSRARFAVILAAQFIGRDAALAAGLGAFLGHLFPVWLRFKGGKGVATYIGILIGFAWIAAAGFRRDLVRGRRHHALFVAVGPCRQRGDCRRSCGCSARADVAILFIVLTALVFIMHRANIARLIAGTEPQDRKIRRPSRERRRSGRRCRADRRAAARLAAPDPQRECRAAHVPHPDQSFRRRARRARRPARSRAPRRCIAAGRICTIEDAERELAAARRKGISFVALGEPDYPLRLRMIDDRAAADRACAASSRR